MGGRGQALDVANCDIKRADLISQSVISSLAGRLKSQIVTSKLLLAFDSNASGKHGEKGKLMVLKE
jgi:hypothetical protein